MTTDMRQFVFKLTLRQLNSNNRHSLKKAGKRDRLSHSTFFCSLVCTSVSPLGEMGPFSKSATISWTLFDSVFKYEVLSVPTKSFDCSGASF